MFDNNEINIANAVNFKSLRENHVSAIVLKFNYISKSLLLPKISRYINKYIYRFGLGGVINRYDNSFSIYSSLSDKKLYDEYRDNDLFCNFGSGAFFHNRWLNYDFPGQSSYYKNLQGVEGNDFFPIDLCEENIRLPLSDNSVSLIYCSHTLEHLEEKYALKFLSECYRVLKVSGVMRIVVPSTDQDHKIAALLNSQDAVSYKLKEKIAYSVAIQVLADSKNMGENKLLDLLEKSKYSSSRFYETCVEQGVSNKFDPLNPERHITYWDYNKLYKVGKSRGFNYCIPLYRGSSTARPFENLNVFDNTEPHASLYFEMIK
jgi:predicted SAM-dependent methyltransferase